MHSCVEMYCVIKLSLLIPGSINSTALEASTLLPEVHSLSRLSNIQEKKYSSSGVHLKMKAPSLFQQLLSTNIYSSYTNI